MPQTLRLRAPGTPLLLRELLAHACPGLGAEAFHGWADAGAIRVGDRIERSLGEVVPPAAAVRVAIAGPPLDAGVWPSLRAGEGGAFVLTVAPPWVRGSLPVRADDPSAALGEIEFEVLEERAGVCELLLQWSDDTTGATDDGPAGSSDVSFRRACGVLERLAASGLCVIGDPVHGGIVRVGGPAWRAPSAGSHADAGDWPEAPVFVEATEPAARPAWTISDATARVLARGHPWIRLDEETDDPAAFRPGARVDLVTRDGKPHGQALVEGAGRRGALALRSGDVAGRVVSAASGRHGEPEWSVEACIARAVERRAELIEGQGDTDAFRLVHGEADGLPGLHVDRLGPLLRVLVTARCALPMVERALVALGGAGPRVVPDPWRIIEVIHLDERGDEPGAAQLERVRVHAYSADPAGAAELGRYARVREGGLSYRVEPGLAEPERSAPGFGLFLDQRENRAAVARRAKAGGRFLNLFAHTGAFSVAWLAAGADEVVSVDLSAAYLRWLDENLVLNADAGVDPGRHVAVRQDGRRYLERLDGGERFDGIVLDPPTAAAAGRRFFSVRKDAVPMIALCLGHLAPGGRLLVTLNDRKARRRLEGAIRDAAVAARVELGAIEPAPPSRDFPSLEGFDEGDPFRGYSVSVR